MSLFDKALSTITRSLDVRLVKQNVLANNLANVDTPNYRPNDVDFETAMRVTIPDDNSTLQSTDSRHMSANSNSMDLQSNSEGGIGDMPLVSTAANDPSIDGNFVDLDKTMSTLAENALQYSASAKAITKKLAILRYACSDGQG